MASLKIKHLKEKMFISTSHVYNSVFAGSKFTSSSSSSSFSMYLLITMQMRKKINQIIFTIIKY